MDVLFIAATKGNNYQLAQELGAHCQKMGLSHQVISLEDYSMPLYTPSAEGQGLPLGAADLKKEIMKARALFWLAPEYNGSTPPIVTNAIAWVSRTSKDWREAFNHKLMAVGTHSGGGGHYVVADLRSQLQILGGIVLPRTIITNSNKPLNPDSATAILGLLARLLG